MPPPGISKRNIFTVAILAVSVLVGAATTAQASTLTVFFSGSIDLTGMGDPADSTYSGFFTWDPARLPFQPNPNSPIYPVESYQLILNGVDRTLLGPGTAGLVVGNDADLNGGPGDRDFLAFLAGLDTNGDAVFVLGFLADNFSFWGTTNLPTDYNFLSMPNRFSGVSLEDGEDEQVGEGGPFVATPVTPVPEPATMTLTALGLAGVIARRRGRQRV
jgi:hypothetical protein